MHNCQECNFEILIQNAFWHNCQECILRWQDATIPDRTDWSASTMWLASSSLGNHHFSLTHRRCLPCSESDADSVKFVQNLISPMARCDRPGSNGLVCINDAALKLIPWESSLHAHKPSVFAVLRLSSVETRLLNQRDLISVLKL